MAHHSEDVEPLLVTRTLADLRGLAGTVTGNDASSISLFWFPFGRSAHDAAQSEAAYRKIAAWCANLPEQGVVCILTSPPDAASLLPFLQAPLRFQLWIPVKTVAYPTPAGVLPYRHAALLVLTRYRGTLRHTKTRIAYTYCPACHKTTKDYGGKKHTYHEYGTLMADVWRDFECDVSSNIEAITGRLKDVFGLKPYKTLQVVDLRSCQDLSPKEEANAASRCPAANSTPLLKSRLINEDCLEALSDLPNESVDFCFADPPYNLQKTYDRWDDALESIEYFAWCDKWLSELVRVLKPGRTLAVLNIPLWAARHYQHLATLLQFQSWIGLGSSQFPGADDHASALRHRLFLQRSATAITRVAEVTSKPDGKGVSFASGGRFLLARELSIPTAQKRPDGSRGAERSMA